MLAEMYGMIPSANTVARAKLPPVNRLNRPANPPPFCCVLMKSAIATGFTPGAVTCAPILYARRQSTVKRILSFRSGVRNRFWTAEAALVWAIEGFLLLDAASGRDNLLTSAGAHLEP